MRTMVRINMLIMAYIMFISSRNNYVILTLISEVLNTMRIYTPCYIAKVIIDMHREYMKMCC